MKLFKYILVTLLVFNIIPNTIFSQIKGEVSIQNEKIIGSDYFFDIYIKTVDKTNGDIFLTHSDFVFEFNPKAFQNPVVSKVPNPKPLFNAVQNGYCTFSSTNTLDSKDASAIAKIQAAYYNGTVPASIEENEIIINLETKSISDFSDLHDLVARINEEDATHCLGRFVISGFKGDGETDLVWKISKPKSNTMLQTYTTDKEGELTIKPVVLEEYTKGGSLVNNNANINVYSELSTSEMNLNIFVYPNPSTGILNIDINEGDKITMLEIVDVYGKQLLTRELIGSHHQLDLSSYNAGAYFLNFKGAEISFTEKFYINK